MLRVIQRYGATFAKWLVLSVLLGGVCGVVGAGFVKCVSMATHLREQHTWLLFCLPIFGVLSVALYKLCRVSGVGTSDVFDTVRTERKLSFWLAPAVFVSSVLSHLGGASVGKEGAALQLGGSLSSLMSRCFHFCENTRHILTVCGMGALFSAAFGTPIGACLFALEVVYVGRVFIGSIFPCVLSSVTAYMVSVALGTDPERFPLPAMSAVSVSSLWRVALIAVVGAFISMLFCNLLHLAEGRLKQWLPNDYLRVAIGGLAIVGFTLLVRTNIYNGAGVDVIYDVFVNGTVRHEAFALKILFTVLAVAVGFKGGEIVPTFFIGATLGASVAALIGLDPAFGAAVGMAALFCGVTNCPLATLVLSVELFGGQCLPYIAVAVVIAFLLSGHYSLYSTQRLLHEKVDICVEE